MMLAIKHLYEIAWQVTEPEYRQDPALSYSTLARYEREGFSKLNSLYDSIYSPSLTFGSVVDELITGDEKSFNERFVIAEFPELKPSAEPVVKAAYELYGDTYAKLTDIGDSQMLTLLDEHNYFKHWKKTTRLEDIRKQNCCDYYRLLRLSSGKEIISQKVYDDAFACVVALRESPATRAYFSDNLNGNIVKYYQLKFKTVIGGIEYRCMADEILVDYDRKIVVPIDLKTSGNPEYQFPHSFMHWRYDIQARLYWRIIRNCMDNDEFFKDFTLADYRFIVVNRESKNPLVWHFDQTQKDGEIQLGGRKLRAPWDIGKELRGYLDNMPKVPAGIKQVGMNDITLWLNKDYEPDQNQTE